MPQVRSAACNALGRLATDFGEPDSDDEEEKTFAKLFHASVLPALCALTRDAIPKVQARALVI